MVRQTCPWVVPVFSHTALKPDHCLENPSVLEVIKGTPNSGRFVCVPKYT